jgi:hypothetical protein
MGIALVRRGADVDAANIFGVTALHNICARGTGAWDRSTGGNLVGDNPVARVQRCEGVSRACSTRPRAKSEACPDRASADRPKSPAASVERASSAMEALDEDPLDRPCLAAALVEAGADVSLRSMGDENAASMARNTRSFRFVRLFRAVPQLERQRKSLCLRLVASVRLVSVGRLAASDWKGGAHATRMGSERCVPASDPPALPREIWRRILGMGGFLPRRWVWLWIENERRRVASTYRRRRRERRTERATTF